MTHKCARTKFLFFLCASLEYVRQVTQYNNALKSFAWPLNAIFLRSRADSALHCKRTKLSCCYSMFTGESRDYTVNCDVYKLCRKALAKEQHLLF